MGPDPFSRIDASDDHYFYAYERKVTHIETGAIEALRSHYAQVLPTGGAVLDLMSSWRSHLPDGLGRVAGLGMNEPEMVDNPALSDHVVHDLNLNPALPYADGEFDAVVCAVSVQYLTRPVEVFTDVRRVLRPGGPFVVSFSNRCFPTKAVAIWRNTGARDHIQLVGLYLRSAGFDNVRAANLPSSDDPIYVVEGNAPPAAATGRR